MNIRLLNEKLENRLLELEKKPAQCLKEASNTVSYEQLKWFAHTLSEAVAALDDQSFEWLDDYNGEGEDFEVYTVAIGTDRGMQAEDLDQYILYCGSYYDALSNDPSVIADSVPQKDRRRFQRIWNRIEDLEIWGEAEEMFVAEQVPIAKARLRRILQTYPMPADASEEEQEAYKIIQQMLGEGV